MINKFIKNIKTQRFVVNYGRMWPYIKPVCD